ncbi:unnamed protein product [Ectocarpus fasciculatus]
MTRGGRPLSQDTLGLARRPRVPWTSRRLGARLYEIVKGPSCPWPDRT